MEVRKFATEGLLLLLPRVFHDERGYFLETYHAAKYAEEGIPDVFVQDNESRSAKNIVRGLHFQDHPYAQGKLVRVVAGSVFDVAVDLRLDSPTFGKWEHVLLTAGGHEQFWIPPGFAHGFLSLEEGTIVSYKCTSFYQQAAERTIRWDDPDLAIQWPVDEVLISSKDSRGESFRECKKMTIMNWTDILLVVILFFGFSLITNGLFLKFSDNLGLRTAKTNGVRWTATQKPSFGGITFYILFLISVIAYSMMDPGLGINRSREFLGFMLAVSVGFIAGLFDDAFDTKPLIKLGMQILVAVVLIFSGTFIQVSGFWYVDYMLTLVWVIGMMNAINLLDNMDAIASVVTVGILACFLVIMQLNGMHDGPYLFVTIGLMAAIGGFLFFNWHPSKLFMGDTGSMFLGTVVAFLGIRYGWNLKLDFAEPDVWQRILAVVVIFIVPLTDTTTVFFKRIISGRSPFIGGKDHTTHHLSYLGLGERAVAMVYCGIGLFCILAIVKMLPLLGRWNGFIALGYTTFVSVVFLGLFYIAHINRDRE